MKRVLLDTNVYVGWLREGRRADLMVGHGFLRYLSSIVHMELSIGATTRAGKRAVAQLARAYTSSMRVVVPTAATYVAAGEALAALRARGREIRRASFVDDVLIALSARSIGAVVVTADMADFEAIREVVHVKLEPA